MKISMIVAKDNKSAIGKEGRIPWHIPGDLRRFKHITSGASLIMGMEMGIESQ